MNAGMNRVTSDAEQSRSAAWRWGSLIVLLLASQVAIGVAAIVLASSDASVSVVPGYHQKAMLWDESVALRNSSRILGWTAELRVVPEPSVNRLTWTVRDRAGNELENLRGRVLMFHHARAGDPVHFRIEVEPDGIKLDRAGLWQFEMTLDGPDSSDPSLRFFDSQSIDVKRAK